MTKYKYFTEKDLYAAGQLSKYKDLAAIPPAAELKGRYAFSEVFERKIAEIYKIFDSPRRNTKVVKRVLMVAAIIALLIALAMSASALCNRIYELFLTHYDDHASGVFVSVQQDDSSYIEMRGDLSVLYYPSYLPRGFRKTDSSSDDITYRQTVYTNRKGEIILLKQEALVSYYNIDNEEADFIEIIDHEITYYCLCEDGQSTIIWSQDGYAFHLVTKRSLDESLKIARSLISE